MLRDGVPIGSIAVTRAQVGLLPNRQIELLKTFADQAVIAIENVRLFEAEQQRTRELSEALEQQTATSKVLSIISSTPGELEPVFRSMLANAVRICEGKFGTLYLREADGFRTVATHNAPPAYMEARMREALLRPPPDVPLGRVAVTKQVVQIADIKKTQSYIEGNPFIVTAVDLGGYRTVLAVPMLKDNELIGSVNINRQEVRPFTDKQIELVTNFAAQAVIAIENTRLLNELRESLEQQIGTSEVLRVISSSPGELNPCSIPCWRRQLNSAQRATARCGYTMGMLSARPRYMATCRQLISINGGAKLCSVPARMRPSSGPCRPDRRSTSPTCVRTHHISKVIRCRFKLLRLQEFEPVFRSDDA